MTCKCGSTRIMGISTKHNDLASMRVKHLDIDYDGYMPYLGLLGGDYTNLEICMDCGQIQGWQQITDDDVTSCEELEDFIEQQAEERARRERRQKEIADAPDEKPITLAGLRGPTLDNGQTVSWPKV